MISSMREAAVNVDTVYTLQGGVNFSPDWCIHILLL